MYSILSAAESIQILAVVGEAKPHTEQSGWPSHIVRLKVRSSKKKKKKRKYIIFNFQMQHSVCMECVLGHIVIH